MFALKKFFASLFSDAAAGQVAVLPGVGDAKGALVAERAGYPVTLLSATKVAERLLGERDEGLVSPSELASVVRHVKPRATRPLLVNMQSGFGNQLTAHFVARDLVAAGADGLVVSDQAFPAHTDPDAAVVEGLPALEARLRAVRDACDEDGVAVVARLDGVGAREGAYDLAEAVLRASRVLSEGLADAVAVSLPADADALGELARLAAGMPVGVSLRGSVTREASGLAGAARRAGVRLLLAGGLCPARVPAGALRACGDALAPALADDADAPAGAGTGAACDASACSCGAAVAGLTVPQGRVPSDAAKPTRMRAAFKAMCFSGDLVRMVVAPDALSARIAQSVGFKAIFSAGYGTAASRLAMPDRGIADFGLMADNAREVINAVDIPVFVDGDTGYGDEANIARMVQVYEDLGAAGLFIEDQVWPKRCGHMDGKAVVSREEGIARVAAAAAARRHDDFLIMSRTDAYASFGLDEALARTRAYHEAGADLCFIEAPKTVEDMRRIPQLFHDAPLMANMIESGKTPLMTDEEIHDAGFAIAVHPCGIVYTEAYATHRLLSDMVEQGGDIQADVDQMITFPQFNHFVGLEKLNDLERRYAQGE